MRETATTDESTETNRTSVPTETTRASVTTETTDVTETDTGESTRETDTSESTRETGTGETTDTRTAFVEATYCALCEYGYANVTMQDIADRTDRSKAALHYHFDGRDDLFREFLSYLHDDFVERTANPTGETPAARLVDLLRTVLSTPDDPDETVEFTTAYLEMKAQAPYKEELREGLRRIDDHLVDQVATLVAEGVEAGEFSAETDPEAVATFVSTYLHGTWTRSVAAGSDVATMRARLVEYVTEELLVAEASLDTIDSSTAASPDTVDSDAAAPPDTVDSDAVRSDAETTRGETDSSSEVSQ
jgi:AcrR family transcriptional regulator